MRLPTIMLLSAGILSAQAPTIVSTSPAQNALAVAADATVSVTFDVDMDAATLNAATFVVNGSLSGLISGSYGTVTNTPTFTPDSPFKVGEQVSVTLTTGIQSTGGTALASPYSWSFTAVVLGGSGVFAAKTDYAAGRNPLSVFVSDLDGDGDADLAVANLNGGNVSVLLGQGDGTFAAKTDYSTGSNQYSVFAADLDGDGDVDLAVANWTSGNVSVLLNNGSGSYAAAVNYGVESGPVSVTAADLDGDGDADLAVANLDSNSVSVLLGQGDGTFAVAVNYAVGSRPFSVTAADLDGDGDIDLAVANSESDNVSVLLGQGDGTFAVAVNYSVGSLPYSVTAADLDGDGDIDLAVANWTSGNVSVLLNNGAGSFATAVNYSAGDGPQSLTAADLDGDGDIDLAVANTGSDNLSVLLGQGDGTFADAMNYDVGSNPYSVTAADLDGDGDMDLAVANSASDNVSVLLNRSVAADVALSAYSLSFGSIKFGATDSLTFKVHNNGVDSTLQVFGITSSSAAFSVDPSAFSVLPGDSATLTITFSPSDMLTYSDSLTIMSNDPLNPTTKVYISGTVNPIVAVYPALNALNVPLGDPVSVTFAADMNPTTINANTFVIHGGYTGTVSGTYAYNNSTGTAAFTPDSPFKLGEQVSVTLTTGVAIAAGYTLASPLVWDFTAEVWGGSGTYGAAVNYSAGVSQSVTAADLDGDGDTDLVTANTFDGSVSVLLGNGDGTYAAAVNYGVGANPSSVIAADLDGDGDIDLAVANTFSDNVSVLLGHGDGTFAARVDYGVGSFPQSVTTADLDGDGEADLAVVNSGDNNVSVLLNNGDGTFASKVDYSVGSGALSVTAADLDGDGDIDLAVAVQFDFQVAVLLNSGSGTFAAYVDYRVGSTPWSVTAADLDGDGDMDLATANLNGNNVSVLLGNGDGTFAARTDYSVGLQPNSVTAADLDGDGDIDLAVANNGSSNLTVLLGNGDGSFAPKVNFIVGDSPRFVTAADLDGDGDIDMAVAVQGNGRVWVLLNRDGYSARLASLGPEVAGDVALDYHVSFPSGVPINLQVDYSINQGASWAVPTLLGDTTALGPESYDGTLIWQSEADLPGVDLPDVRLRITPYTADTTGRSHTTSPFRLDNNHEPVASLAGPANEQTGDVTLSYTLADDEGDTLSFSAEYSANRGGVWQGATVTGQTDGLDQSLYAGSFVWDTGADLPGHEDSLTWFRLIPKDYEPGTADTIIFHLDNNAPPNLTITSTSIDSVVSRVAVDYILTDAESDTLSITADYSLDGGQNWLPSAVGSAGSAIAPGDYGGSVDWLAFANGLAGTTPNVQLRLLPQDYDTGAGDTLSGLTVIYHTGDYTGDLMISTGDLVQFAAAWNADPQELAYELGPATGTVPDLTPQPDGVLDFEDLVVFAQMWNWSFANNGFAKSVPALAKTITTEPSLRLIQVVPDNLWEWDGSTIIRVEVAETADLMMIDGLMTVNPRQVRVRGFQAGGYMTARWETAPLFVQTNADSSQVLFAIAGLSLKDDQGAASEAPLLTFEADLGNHGKQTLILDYTLWNTSGEPIESATVFLEIENILPKQFALHQNYPNPFNPVTTIRYELPRPAKVELRIYNLLGREVIRLVDADQTPGYHAVIWSGRDGSGRNVSSGIYIARLVAPGYAKSMKMVLLK